MDEALYRRVLGALTATHAPTTSPDVRQAAFAELEAFKLRADCAEYAFYILSNLEHDDFARHFALQCLGVAAAALGADPGPGGEALRSRCASLLLGGGGLRPLGAEAGHVREGAARLLADLAERAFPQAWPGFMEGLLGAWQGSADGSGAEIAMMVMRNVAEDCTDAQFNAKLSVGRRNDVLRDMREPAAAGHRCGVSGGECHTSQRWSGP